MTYYLKYRSKKIDELDSEEVRNSLINIVKSGEIPHALLFAGPKGSGKTSAARILAKIINCESTSKTLRGPKLIEPCNKCEACLSISKGSNIDVIEMDAASHRGIDDVRLLRDAVKLAPARAKKKVYIFDEAHMLTTEASNALLKTLEEPPDHVYFILATTNPEKLISTIRSRVTSVNFTKAGSEEIVRSLSRIVKEEELKIDTSSLLMIAKASGGSFRDAVKALEAIVGQKVKLDSKSIEEFLFKKRELEIDKFLVYLAKKEIVSLLSEVEDYIQKGGTVENLLSNLLPQLREELIQLVTKEGREGRFSKKELVYLIELIQEAARNLKGTFIEQLPLEIALVKWCEGKSQELSQKESGGKDEITVAITKTKIKVETPKVDLEHSVSSKLKEVSEETWKKILTMVKPINTSIEALLRAAKPIDFDGRTLTLGVFYRFHKERLEDVRSRKILEDVVREVLGLPVRISCTLAEPPPRKDLTLTEGGDKDIIEVAEDIFGS